jgi:hypothetical protein
VNDEIRPKLALYRVLVERTIVDQYEVWAEDADEANDTVSNRIASGWWWQLRENRAVISEELEPEVRKEETTEVREWT